MLGFMDLGWPRFCRRSTSVFFKGSVGKSTSLVPVMVWRNVASQPIKIIPYNSCKTNSNVNNYCHINIQVRSLLSNCMPISIKVSMIVKRHSYKF